MHQGKSKHPWTTARNYNHRSLSLPATARSLEACVWV